jgi:hypothetical protein
VGLIDNSQILEKRYNSKINNSNFDSSKIMDNSRRIIDDNDESLDFITPSREMVFWPSSNGGGSRPYTMSKVDEMVEFKSFHLSF